MRSGLAVCVLAGSCRFTAGAVPAAAGADASGSNASGSDGSAIIDAPGTSEPALIQQAQAYAPNGSPLSAMFTVAPVAGDLLVMIGAANHGGLASVAGGGAMWTRATRSLTNSNIELWFGVTDGSSSTVTITFPSNPLSIWLAISEWSGMATTNVLDGAISVSGNASPAASGGITTTNAHDLVLFAVADGAPNSFGTPTGGTWTGLTPVMSTPVVQFEWCQVVSAPGMYDPQVTETAHSWDAALVALKAAP